MTQFQLAQIIKTKDRTSEQWGEHKSADIAGQWGGTAGRGAGRGRVH